MRLDEKPLLRRGLFISRDYCERMRRTMRAVRILMRDGGLPRWLRGLAAVGLAPIPGPVDEVVLVLVAAILWVGYRERLRMAWREADRPTSA
jgi:hypothetical protein